LLAEKEGSNEMVTMAPELGLVPDFRVSRPFFFLSFFSFFFFSFPFLQFAIGTTNFAGQVSDKTAS